MSIPSYGAMPLSKMFLLVRILQALCMIIVIGICSNFVQMIVVTGAEPPKEFVGTLSVVSASLFAPFRFTTDHLKTCIATLYIMVSVGYYWSFANLGLLVMAGVDSLLLIAFIVCAVTLGKPMSYLNCYVIGKSSYETDAANAYAFVASASQNMVENMKNWSGSSVWNWAGATKANCFQGKTIWGLSIALWYVLLSATSRFPRQVLTQVASSSPPPVLCCLPSGTRTRRPLLRPSLSKKLKRICPSITDAIYTPFCNNQNIHALRGVRVVFFYTVATE